MRARAILTLAVMILTALLPGCESVGRTLETAAEIVQQNPELIKDEEDRQKWLAGARAVKGWVSEIDTAEELAMGQSLAVRTFVAFGQPHPDAALQRYVTTVGRLVALQSERPTLPYSFAVVESDRPNALALPGGYIFVSTGLLKSLKSEAELACILGHEICHVAQKHGVEIVARDRKISGLVDFGAALDEDVAEYRQFIDLVYQKLTTEGYDRRYETIADEAGTRYAYRAGYYPAGLLPFLEAERASGKAQSFEVFKTHPDPADRIKKIRRVLVDLGDYTQMPRLSDRYQKEVLSKLR